MLPADSHSRRININSIIFYLRFGDPDNQTKVINILNSLKYTIASENDKVSSDISSSRINTGRHPSPPHSLPTSRQFPHIPPQISYPMPRSARGYEKYPNHLSIAREYAPMSRNSSLIPPPTADYGFAATHSDSST